MRGRTTSRRRRGALAAVVALACGAVLLLPRPAATDAAFTDAELAGSGTVRAATLTSPTNMTCTVKNDALGIFASVTITWTSAYPLTPPTGPTTRLTAASSGTTSVVTGVSSSGSGPFSYSVTLTKAVLESLVTNLLGSSTTFTVANVAGANWTSSTQVKTLTMTIAGLGAACV